MSLPKPEKDIPVFASASINAMGASGQGIALILKKAGWIKVVDELTEVSG